MISLPEVDEVARLAALRTYGVLDTPPEAGFEHITSVVARLYDAPIVAVTLVDAERQWFKSIRGLDWQETPRHLSFCAQAMLVDEGLVIPDTTLDPRFVDHPFVTSKPSIRFYAGAPLRTPEGYPLGALCVMDHRPRQFSRPERQTLAEMAALVEDELLLRRVANKLREEYPSHPPPEQMLVVREKPAQSDKGLRWPEGGARKPRSRRSVQLPCLATADNTPSGNSNRFRDIVEQATDALFVYDMEGRFVEVNSAACWMFGYEQEELLSLNLVNLEIGFDPIKGTKRWAEMTPGEPVTMEGRNRRKDGNVFWAEARISVVETKGERLLLALVRDITGRKQAETLLQIRARQQKAVAKLGVKALRGEKIDTLLHEAVTAVGDTLEIEVCRVLEHLPERGEFVTRAGLNVPAAELGQPAASDHVMHAAGYVMQTGEPVIVKDVLHDERFEPTPWLRASGAVSGLHVSIGGDGSHSPHYGLLAAYTRESRVFTDDDVSFVQSVANVLAAAIARQRSEDELRTVEARYQRIVAHTPGVVYQYLSRPDGTADVPFIGEGCREVFGRGPEEIKACPSLAVEAVHPDERSNFRRMIREARLARTPFHWLGRLLLPGEKIRWVRFDARFEGLPDGGVICNGIVVDVTEDEKRKEALRQSEQRFRLANFHAPFPIMLHAEGGEVLQVNDAWVHITGYLPEEIRTVEDWLRRAYSSEESRDEVRRHLASLPEHIGAVEASGRRIRCAGGGERIWDVRSANLDRLPDGRWLHISTATDVTEQRRHEAALRLAKEEAERANAAKSLFLSRMSHELRTPLNAILGFGQVLELAALDGQERQSVEQILRGGKHLLSLVDEVLDLARVESGELDLRLSAVSLPKLANECINLVARAAQTGGVACKVETRSAWRVPVLADESRLRQVLLNLLSNAIKYSREGGRVLVSFERAKPGRVRIKITDEGSGITPEGLPLLFVPFERLGQEFGQVEGTGLGLVVSKQLVEAMGGQIGVESEVGRGSVFWVDLPTASPEVSAKNGMDTPLAPVTNLRPVEASATVLYIEDNHSNVQVVKMVVERLRPSWRFFSAGDGVTGLQRARDSLPDVILLDLQLPGLNGDAVLARLQADPTTHHIPVLLLSADAMAHSRERLLALGANDYLPKPFNVNDLLVKMDSLLGKMRLGPPAGSIATVETAAS